MTPINKTILVKSALLLTLVLSAEIISADPPTKYPFVSYDEGLSNARKSGKRIFLYFGRYGCGYCDKTNKESFSKKEVRKRYTSHYSLIYIDAESGNRLTLPSGEQITEMQFGSRIKALVTPIFIFMEPNGKVILKVPGFQTANDLLELDKFINNNHYQSKSLTRYLSEK